jgi:hypothetical protein
MPVSLLICEGSANSLDVRVLAKLVAGRCAVLPDGGKYGMGDRIKARRDAMRRETVFGLLDGDFVASFPLPTDQPRRWEGSDGVHLGWRWERKEIENYLIDPMVVRRALGVDAPSDADYAKAMEQARDAIAVYQAARIALATCRRRLSPLPDRFGPARGRAHHPFPDALDKASCLDGIRQVLETYHRNVSVADADVYDTFTSCLTECQPDGVRFRCFLTAFSGKDMLCAMDPSLRTLGFAGAAVFLERISVNIERTAEDVGNWLPEWRSLQEAIDRT